EGGILADRSRRLAQAGAACAGALVRREAAGTCRSSEAQQSGSYRGHRRPGSSAGRGPEGPFTAFSGNLLISGGTGGGRCRCALHRSRIGRPISGESNMAFNPLRERGIPLEKQFRNWSELNVKPYDKETVHPYSRCRGIV